MASSCSMGQCRSKQAILFGQWCVRLAKRKAGEHFCCSSVSLAKAFRQERAGRMGQAAVGAWRVRRGQVGADLWVSWRPLPGPRP